MQPPINESFSATPAFETLCELAADGLAEEGFAVVDGFLSQEETTAVRRAALEWQAAGGFKPAGTGTGETFSVDGSVRGDRIRWIDEGAAAEPTRLLLGRVRALMGYLNRTCFLGLKDFEAHYAVYPTGAFYERHVDQFAGRGHRRISFVCYLNDGWQETDGGHLRLYLPATDGKETVRDVAPLGGRLACFRSELIPHEVLPAQRPRHSLTGWMLDQLQTLSQML